MLLVKFILKPWTLDLVSTKNFLSFLKHAKQNHGALVWVTWSLVCLVSSLKLICDLFWDCICLEVGSWTGWCGVIKIKLSKQNLKISVLELTSLFLSFHINRLSPDLHPPHHVVRTNAVAFSAHSHQTFSSHACCSALCTLSLTLLVLNWFYLSRLSLGCTWWFHFVEVHFVSLKLTWNMMALL